MTTNNNLSFKIYYKNIMDIISLKNLWVFELFKNIFPKSHEICIAFGKYLM